MRSDLRLLGDDRDVNMIDDPAKVADQVCRMLEKQLRCGSLPLRIGRRKVLPDVPRLAAPSSASVIEWSATSASLCPDRPATVRNGDAAEHDGTVAFERVDVEAEAGSRYEAGRQKRLCSRTSRLG